MMVSDGCEAYLIVQPSNHRGMAIWLIVSTQRCLATNMAKIVGAIVSPTPAGGEGMMRSHTRIHSLRSEMLSGRKLEARDNPTGAAL